MSESTENITASDGVNKPDVYVPDRGAGASNVAITRTRFRLKRIPIILRIESWILYQSSNECICDECIADQIGTTDVKKVTLAAKKLAVRESRFFTRWRGQCSGCGQVKAVMVARRLTWA